MVKTRSALLIVLPIVLQSNLSSGKAPNHNLKAEETVVIFGNSIAEGFIAGSVDTVGRYSNLIQEELNNLGQAADVINSGKGGDTSLDGYLRFDNDVLRHDPQVVTISFGTNDYMVTEGGHPVVIVEDFVIYLEAIVDRVRETGAYPILLTPVPVIPERFYETHDRSSYEPYGGVEILWEVYDDAVRRLGREKGVNLVDLRGGFADSVGVLMGADGTHPNRRGHRAIANLLLPYIVNRQEAGGGNGEGGTIDRDGINNLRLFPNPFKHEDGHLMRLAFETVDDGRISVEVYDLSGKRVSTPVNSVFRVAGNITEFWDGNSADGGPLASGVYLVKLSWIPNSGGRSSHQVKKVAIIR
jgi:lysophospholipase L1-like esterase